MQVNCTSPADVSALADDCRAKRERAEITRARLRVGQASYAEAVADAQAFCAAFDRYHKAKFGRSKRLDYRAFLR